MAIDYAALLPAALRALYPDASERERVAQRLQQYGAEPSQREPARVRLGVLYLTAQAPDKLESYLQLACTDYRDLLCAAEYPQSSRQWRLQRQQPAAYKALQERDAQAYLAWIDGLRQA